MRHTDPDQLLGQCEWQPAIAPPEFCAAVSNDNSMSNPLAFGVISEIKASRPSIMIENLR